MALDPPSLPLVRFAPDVVVRQVGDDAIALKLNTEMMYALNETAARVAVLIDAGLALPAIVAQLSHEYHQPLDVIAAQVDALLADFMAKGLLAPDADSR